MTTNRILCNLFEKRELRALLFELERRASNPSLAVPLTLPQRIKKIEKLEDVPDNNQFGRAELNSRKNEVWELQSGILADLEVIDKRYHFYEACNQLQAKQDEIDHLCAALRTATTKARDLALFVDKTATEILCKS